MSAKILNVLWFYSKRVRFVSIKKSEIESLSNVKTLKRNKINDIKSKKDPIKLPKDSKTFGRSPAGILFH